MTTTSSKRTWRWWVNVIAFVAIAIIGIVLFVSVVFNLHGKIFTAMQTIGNVLAYIVAAACAFTYVSGKRGKKGLVYILIWAGAVILITIAVIIPLFK